MCDQVLLDGGDEVRRDRDVPDDGVGLRRADDHLATHPDHSASDLHAVRLQVEVIHTGNSEGQI